MSRGKKYSYDEAENAFTSEGGFLPRRSESGCVRPESTLSFLSESRAVDRTALQKPEAWLLRQSVGFDGRHYQYNGYRYDRLADAIAHVALTRTRPSLLEPKGPYSPERSAEPPTARDRETMASLGIVAIGSAYRWRAFRYDRLEDAVAYATLVQRRGE
ncbi:MAG TPA: hypothetical protein VM555_10770 [Tahibacter sp.]|nr:hypothetical protein [Tahibacter sp.]